MPTNTLLAWVLALSFGCASRLPQERVSRKPQSTNITDAVNLDAVSFVSLRDAETVNLGAYLRQENLDYALLVFGALGCGICRVEGRKLEQEIIGQHPLFLSEEGQKFRVIGVNTDRDRPGKVAAQLARDGFDFVRWQDAGGQAMLEYFLPAGRAYGVPLMVLVRPGGIVFRVLPAEAESTDLFRLMDRIGEVMRAPAGQRSNNPLPGEESPQSPSATSTAIATSTSTTASSSTSTDTNQQPPTSSTSRARNLDDMAAGRLAYLPLRTCDAQQTTAEAASAQAEWTVLQLVRGTCSEQSCGERAQRLAELCQSGPLPSGSSCAVLNIAQQTPAACRAGLDYFGGDEIWKAYQTHFNWDYPISEDQDYNLVLPEVTGPLLMVFAKDGRLVASRQGELSADAAVLWLTGLAADARAQGPNFRFFEPTRGDFGFAEILAKSTYTIVNVLSADPPCASCLKALQQWSQPGDLVDFCAARPTQCQIVALESDGPVQGSAAKPEYYRRLLEGYQRPRGSSDPQGNFPGFNPLGIRVPLLLESYPVSGPNGNEYLRRFAGGYLGALRPNMPRGNGSLIFDREGKILLSLSSEEMDADTSRVQGVLRDLVSKP